MAETSISEIKPNSPPIAPVQVSTTTQESSSSAPHRKPGLFRYIDSLRLRMARKELKTSNRPEIQTRVENERGQLMNQHLFANPESATQQARTMVAREIKMERLRNEHSNTKSVLHTTTQESAEFWRMATTDNKTDLHNELGFKIRFEDMLKQARDRNLPLALFLIDLNSLKKVNDLYGHGVGDDYLKLLANLLKENQRQDEEAIQFSEYEEADGRIGGDEFGIVLKNVNQEGVLKFWKRLNGILSSTAFQLPNGTKLPIGLGAGYCVIMPDELAGLSDKDISGFAESKKELTDRAMYIAKNRSKTPGFNLCELFNVTDMSSISNEERLAVEESRKKSSQARDKQEELVTVAAD